MNNNLMPLGSLVLSVLILATNSNTVFSQNLTTNISSDIENMSATINQTVSQLGQNISNAVGNASQQVNQTITEPSNQSSSNQSSSNQSSSNQSSSNQSSSNQSSSNQSSSNQSSGVNESAGAIGSAQQLSQVLGNNSEMLQNRTSIGSTPTVGNATESSANITLGKLGENTSETTSGLLNRTGEVAKKVIGGAADVLTNITSEIKKGVGAK